jgi:VanZ family protein
MIAIYIGSSIPGKEFPVYEGVWDFVVKKSGHLAEFGLLAALLLRGMVWGRPAPAPRAHLAAAFGVAVLFALGDEFHQQFTPGRTARALDVAIDALGSGLGLGLFYAWQVIRQTRSQSPQSRSTRPRA